MKVTQSEFALTGTQTKLAEAQYDSTIVEVTLADTTGGRAQLEIDPTIR